MRMYSAIERSALPVAVLSSVVLAVLGGTGCAHGIFADPSGYDAQGCAETSLRNGIDRDTALDAKALFGEACRFGDGGACSGLGVIYERGLADVRRDDVKAASYYRRACELGNARGCENLRALAMSAIAATPSLSAPREARVCTTGHEPGCTVARRP